MFFILNKTLCTTDLQFHYFCAAGVPITVTYLFCGLYTSTHKCVQVSPLANAKRIAATHYSGKTLRFLSQLLTTSIGAKTHHRNCFKNHPESNSLWAAPETERADSFDPYTLHLLPYLDLYRKVLALACLPH